jgi:hypothetical protein
MGAIDGGHSKQREDRRDDRGSRKHDSESSSGSKRTRDHGSAQNGQSSDPNLGSLEDDPRIDSRGVKHVRKRGVFDEKEAKSTEMLGNSVQSAWNIRSMQKKPCHISFCSQPLHACGEQVLAKTRRALTPSPRSSALICA